MNYFKSLEEDSKEINRKNKQCPAIFSKIEHFWKVSKIAKNFQSSTILP